jgi:tetratricopeptide (TPR) repeat protein
VSESTQRTGALPNLEQQLSAVNQLIYAGRHDEAIAAAQQLATIEVVRVPAQALHALAAAMAGQRDAALALLQSFTDPAAIPKAEVALAVGSAWFKLGEMAQAIGFLTSGLALQPGHPLLVARLAACLLAAGRVPDAMPLLQQAVELLPDSGGAWLNLARAQLMLSQNEAAMASLDKAAPLPDKEPALYRMTRAEALARLERHTEAEALLRQAVAESQDGAVPALVSQLGARGQHDEAWTVLREALAEKPDAVPLLELAAELAQVRGRFGEADRFLDRALQHDPDNAALWTRRAMLASRRAGEKLGREAADKALALTQDQVGPPRAHALAAHAQVLAEEEQHQAAEAAYREALAVFAPCIPALNGLGHLLMQRGKVDEATALFEELKKIAPLQGWSQLIQAREVPEDPRVLEQMALAAHRPSLEGPVQSHLLFTLAAAWEKKKDFAQAWAFAAEANAAAKEHLPYRPEGHRQRVERETARFSRAFMDSRKGWGSQSPVPTFVLGMPRSGTTLVEQILGSHSQVFGAGELSLVPELIQKLSGWEAKLGSRREYPECIDDMTQAESLRFAQKHLEELQAYAPQAQRIVDKLPHNFEHIGLIKLLFPQAKILHLKREPRDVAMSNYFTDYAAKFGGMGFAYDLSWIGEQLVDHQRLMDHWHAMFPGQILEVDYDLLVEDVDGWAHQIIDYLELPWEDGVLAFQDLERSVKTASVWQVRQPVYTTSKAKWKRYAAHLDALEASLAEVPPQPLAAAMPRLEPGLFLQAQALLTADQAAEAEALYRKLLQARPAHAAGHHFLGAALYQMGRLDEARKAMRRSLELLPGNVQWLENLRAAEAALGNTAEAERLAAQIAQRRAGGKLTATSTEDVHVA